MCLCVSDSNSGWNFVLLIGSVWVCLCVSDSNWVELCVADRKCVGVSVCV